MAALLEFRTESKFIFVLVPGQPSDSITKSEADMILKIGTWPI